MSNNMNAFVWLLVAVALMIFEGVTVQLVSIWFIIGTIPTIIASLLGAPLWLQLVIFLVVSMASLVFLRPIAKKRLTATRMATNADRVIGMSGVVLEDINNLMETGRVSANGLDWTARAQKDEETISKGSVIKVVRIDGVKLIVKPIKE